MNNKIKELLTNFNEKLKDIVIIDNERDLLIPTISDSTLLSNSEHLYEFLNHWNDDLDLSEYRLTFHDTSFEFKSWFFIELSNMKNMIVLDIINRLMNEFDIYKRIATIEELY